MPNKSVLTNMNSQLFHKTPHHTYHMLYSRFSPINVTY